MLCEKIRRLRRERAMTQGELAEMLGVTQQAVAKWEAGRALPELDKIHQLAEVFDVSADCLLGREDGTFGLEPVAMIPIIGTVRAGYNAFALEEELGKAPAEVKNPAEYRYLRVRGDSMAPYIREGDLALVRIQPTLSNGDLGVVIYGDGEATLKKYYRRDGAVTLVPLNEAYEPVTLRGEELSRLFIFGKVVETRSFW